MTREESLIQLKEFESYFQDRIEKETDVRFDKEQAKKDLEAIKMAIRALEQEPSISEDGTLTVNVEDGNKVGRVLVCGDNHFGGLYYPEQEPCEDCISRQAAIDLADELKDSLPDDDRLSDMIMSHNEGILEYQTQLSLLPSVHPVDESRKSVDERVDESVDDCISRKEVLKIMDWGWKKGIYPSNKIAALPPVQPKQIKSCYKMCDRWQRTGKWIAENSVLRCSLCNESVMRYDKYPFCPNCGAKMEVEE